MFNRYNEQHIIVRKVKRLVAVIIIITLYLGKLHTKSEAEMFEYNVAARVVK